MTLIPCPDCRQPVSQYAPACPGCGRPAYPARPAPWAPAPASPLAAEKQGVQVAYGLWAASYVFGPLLFAAVILCYVRRNDVRGSWLEAHYDWLIDTFWAGLLGGMVLGMSTVVLVLLFFPLGIMMAMAVVLAALGWPIYRLVRGYTALGEGRAPVGTLSPPRW